MAGVERLWRRVPAAWREQGPALYRLLWLVLAVAALVAGLRAVWSFTIDDAGISYAYARHIADGEGPVAVVGGPWVEGYSNPLWVFALVPLHWLGLDIPTFAKWLGAALFALALGLGVALATRAQGRRFRDWGAAELGLTLAASLCLEVVVWAPAGLENALFMALSLGLVLLALREPPESFDGASLRAPLAAGLLAFGLSITRPEGVMYAAPLIALGVLRALLRRAPWRHALCAPLGFLLPLAVYHLGHYLTFGQLLPNTYYAKPASKDYGAGLDYLRRCAEDSGLGHAAPLALLGLGALLWSRTQRWLGLGLGWVALAGVLFVVYSGGDWMPHARFLSLFAPAYLVLAGLGVALLARVGTRLGRGRWPEELLACVLVLPLLWFWNSYQQPRLSALERKGWCHFCERARDTERVQQLSLRAGLPASSWVTQDFGGPAWLSSDSFYPIDFLGLCDRSVALIRRERLRGSIGDDYRLYQYLLHEQPSLPSWVLLPPNFWPRFDLSPEYQYDYFALPPSLVPNARRDSFFVLHRGELIDYFPPVESAQFRPISDRVGLVGFGVFADPAAPQPAPERFDPGARVLLLASVVARGGLRGTETATLRIEAGSQRAETKPLRFDHNLDGVARQLISSEPLALELPLTLPSGPGPYRVSLGIGLAEGGNKNNPRPARAPIFVELGSFEAGEPLPPLRRTLPRFPSALPAARDAELFELEPAASDAIERARRLGRSPAEPELSRRFAQIGQRLAAAGDREQSYLADVWATRVDRRAWEMLADPVFALRPAARGSQHASELALLRRYYVSGRADDLARLIGFYLSEGRPREADYFWQRWPPSAPESDAHTALRRALDGSTPLAPLAPAEPLPEIARDPLGGALDFESGTLEGWSGATDSFAIGPDPERRDSFAFRGEHGQRLLSSRLVGARARGELTSPEFRLDGRWLSVLVGGGTAKNGAGVRLVVEGKVAFTASGNGSDNLMPVFWELGDFAGKLARLVVFDQSAKENVFVDRVLLWR